MTESSDSLSEIHPGIAREIPQKVTILPDAGPEEMTRSAMLRNTGQPYRDTWKRKEILAGLNIHKIKGGTQPEWLTNPDDYSSQVLTAEIDKVERRKNPFK